MVAVRMSVLTKPGLVGAGGGGAAIAAASSCNMKVRAVRQATSWPVLAVWVLLSVFVAATCSLGFLQSAWIVKTEKRHEAHIEVLALGVFSYCYRVDQLEDIMCHLYGGTLDLRRYPSGPWQAACVLYGSGCIFLVCCALASVLCMGLPTDRWRQRVAVAVGHTQAAGVVILLVGLAIYPLGLGSPFVRHHCGAQASLFDAGDCSLGWSYMLAIMASILSLYCPVLAKYSTYKIYEPDYWTYCSNI